MEIIKLQKNHIRDALELVWTVFQEFEAPDYSKEGIEEFKNFIEYPSVIEKVNKGELCFWGCMDNGILTGVIASKGINHICLLFVKKEYHRRGIAKSLFQVVVKECRSKGDLSSITVNSSPYAVQVYNRLGFNAADQEQLVNGIRFTPMLYLLQQRV